MTTFVCEDCHIALKRTDLGVTIIEMFSRPPRPYKLWKADILRCPRCGRAVIQSAHNAYAEHFEHGFEAMLDEAERGVHYYNFERVEDADEYVTDMGFEEPEPV